MPIILTKNISQIPPAGNSDIDENFAALVKKRVHDINARTPAGNYDFIYIVPTRRRVRELQRELIENTAFGKLPVYTLELFALEIFSTLGIRHRMISSSMQGMIIGKVLSTHDFKFFRYLPSRSGSDKVPAGTIKKIVDQIDYLRENGISSEDYEKMVMAADDSERRKLEEFSMIYKRYEENLGDNLIDGAGLLSLVNHEIDFSTISHRLSANLTFFVEGFYNFKKPELDFLKILSSQKNFSFLVKLDCNGTNENLFKTMAGTAADLIARGFKKTVSSKEKAVSRNQIEESEKTIREYFAMNLFSEKIQYSAPQAHRPLAEKLNLEEKVFIVNVQDKLHEIEFVAEKIKEIMKNDPSQKLDGICVASYLPQDYSRLVREVFAKYQIPANVTDRYTLESNNVVNGILSFIDIALTDYERGTLLRAVTNRALTIRANGTGGDEISASEAGSILYHTAALCRFERGLKNFRRAIVSRLEFLSKIENEEPEDTGTRRDIETLTKARKLLDLIEEKLTPFRNAGAKQDSSLAEESRNAVKSLVNSLKIHENIVRLNVDGLTTETVERDARALSAFFDVLDDVVEMETIDVRAKHALPLLDTMVENLRAALSLTRYNIRQKHGYGVYVTALEEIRGLEFDYIFVVGLNEGEFPARYAPEIFLPLTSQKENRQMLPYLQRYLFYQAVSSFKKNLFLVSAMQTDDVRLIRSSFVDEFIKIVEPSFINETKIGMQNIYNVQQLIERYPVSGVQPPVSELLPTNVPRCITAELERYKNNKESEFHGKINRPELIESLSVGFADRIFSSSQLESLAKCGFQFFTRRILQIAEIPEVETSLSAIERGAVLHKILYRFYNELSQKGELERAVQKLPLLLDIGRKVLDELGIEHDLFEVEKEAILGNENIHGTLELFLTKVQAKLSEYGFHPQEFEVSFGMSGEDEPSAVKVGGRLDLRPRRDSLSRTALRGKIDRIDFNEDGSWIFDYKTSADPPKHKDVIKDKIYPQLLLYLNALRQIADDNKPAGAPVRQSTLQCAGAAFISINRDKLLKSEDGSDLIKFIVQSAGEELKYNPTFGSKSKTVSTENYPKTMDALMKETELFIEEKISEVRSGQFNLTRFSRERVCKFCSYSEACRIALKGESFSREGFAR